MSHGAEVLRTRNHLNRTVGETMLTRRRFVADASIASIAFSTHQAVAQAYPTQTIRIIAGYAAGGGIDVVARMLAEPLKAMGQPVLWRTAPALRA
jgi:tripartite-type tricarboxylate transporter receptor subunit TctC